MNTNPRQTTPNEEEKQQKNASQGCLSSVFGFKITRKQEKQTLQPQGQSPLGSNGTEVNDDLYQRPEYISTGSYDWSLRPDELCGPREDFDNKELYNFGRVPLNWDFDANRARPLPFSDEGAYGGGARSTRGSEAQVLSNGSSVNGASIPHVSSKGLTPKQKPNHLVNRSVKVTAKKIGCFRWF